MWFTQLCPHKEPALPSTQVEARKRDPTTEDLVCVKLTEPALCSLRPRAISGASRGWFLYMCFQPDRLLQSLISSSATTRQAARASSSEWTERCTKGPPETAMHVNMCVHACAWSVLPAPSSALLPGSSSPPPPPNLQPTAEEATKNCHH